MADGNPDDNQQDSTIGDLPRAENDDADKCDNIDETITASSSNSSVAEGLSSLISSVMTDFDSRAEATARSQDELVFALDRLTGELDKLLEDAPSPFLMQHAARISGVRKRVKSLNTVLKSIQRRIDNMDHMMSAGVAHVFSEDKKGAGTEIPYIYPGYTAGPTSHHNDEEVLPMFIGYLSLFEV